MYVIITDMKYGNKLLARKYYVSGYYIFMCRHYDTVICGVMLCEY
jgi:hypothetical protein